MTDSKAASRAINNNTPRSRCLMKVLRKLLQACAMLKVQISADYAPSITNIWAVKLPRQSDRNKCSLAPSKFQNLEQTFGPHAIDLFAPTLDSKLERLRSKFWRPGAEGASVFDAIRSSEIACCFPTIGAMPAMQQKVATDKANIALIAPIWEAQTWWPVLQQMTASTQDLGRDDIQRPPGRRAEPRGGWKFKAFRVIGQQPNKRIHRSLRHESAH